MTLPQRIVVATDFSECSRHAVDVAVELAQALRAEVEIVHVWQITPLVAVGLEYAPAELVNAVEDAARAQLDAEVKRVQQVLPSCRGALRGGAAWDEILQAAAEDHADLIVMGTHGRTGLSRALVGSVADRVLRASPLPVVTVRFAPSWRHAADPIADQRTNIAP